jgi:hypothetical protein
VPAFGPRTSWSAAKLCGSWTPPAGSRRRVHAPGRSRCGRRVAAAYTAAWVRRANPSLVNGLNTQFVTVLSARWSGRRFAGWSPSPIRFRAGRSLSVSAASCGSGTGGLRSRSRTRRVCGIRRSQHRQPPWRRDTSFRPGLPGLRGSPPRRAEAVCKGPAALTDGAALRPGIVQG